MRSKRRPSRVFIGLTEISGYCANLKRGFESLGVDTVFLDLSPPVYRYGDDVPSDRLLRLFQSVARRRATTARTQLVRKIMWWLAQSALAPVAFVWSALRCDAFVLIYRSAFIGLGELRLLRLLRRRIVFVCVGTDIRPTYIDGAEMAIDGRLTIDACIRRTLAKKRALGKIERWADVIISHPPFGQLHERPFVSFLHIGLPRTFTPLQHDTAARRSGHVRVLHAPSHPAAKGSSVIRAAVEHLHARGIEFEYVEVVGRPNDELMREIVCSDLVIDQVYGDTPMAGLAADAALLGKPTLVAGYAWEELARFTPSSVFPPTYCCLPEQLEDAIEELVLDEAARRDLGQRAHDFLTREWSAEAVAARFLRLMDGTMPAEWFCDPAEIRYVLGWGQSRRRTQEIVRAVIARGGRGALGLENKPETERAFFELAAGGAAPE